VRKEESFVKYSWDFENVHTGQTKHWECKAENLVLAMRKAYKELNIGPGSWKVVPGTVKKTHENKDEKKKEDKT
jgi:hypothetical protein